MCFIIIDLQQYIILYIYDYIKRMYDIHVIVRRRSQLIASKLTGMIIYILPAIIDLKLQLPGRGWFKLVQVMKYGETHDEIWCFNGL